MTDIDLIDLTPANVERFGIFCVGSGKLPGYRAKVDWYRKQHPRGVRIKLLWSAGESKAVGFIEYAPIESCWRGVEAGNHLVIHCIWVRSARQGAGLGGCLIEAVFEDARKKGKDGVAVVTGSGGRRLGVPMTVRLIRTGREARSSPTPYGVMSLTRGSETLASHHISRRRFQNIVRQRCLGTCSSPRRKGG